MARSAALMIILVTAEGVAVILLGLLVAGLLRSHAEILRRLHELEGNAPASDLPGAREPTTGSDVGHDLEGVTPRGDPIVVTVRHDGNDTLLAFLTSGCS